MMRDSSLLLDTLEVRSPYIWETLVHRVVGLGWGNALQEHLLDAYLAYRSRRT